MQVASFKIWTWVAVSISYYDKYYTMSYMSNTRLDQKILNENVPLQE